MTASGLEEAKRAARRDAKARRAAAHGTVDPGPALEALAAFLAARPAALVAGYLPIATELDPRPTMAARAAHGPVCVPVVTAKAAPLSFRAWSPAAALQPGAFGVQEPADGDWLVPEVIIVPLLAYDAAGYRLGYGGGFYDRTLSALRARGSVTAVGLGYAAQAAPALPREATDAPLDAIVTETGLQRFPTAPRAGAPPP